MRRMLWFLTTVFVIFACPFLWLGIVMNVDADPTVRLVLLFIGTAAGLMFLMKCKKIFHYALRLEMNTWLASVQNAEFSYGWDGTGLAIDLKTQQLHLASASRSKSYAFADLIACQYEIPGYTLNSTSYTGDGAEAAALTASFFNGISNAAQINYAIENTGLQITVNDLEFPRWFIRFDTYKKSDQEIEHEFLHWMQRLRDCKNAVNS